MRQTDPKDIEAVRLAVATVIESAKDPNYIAVPDIIELMGYKAPDTSQGESWGSVSHVTMPVSKVLADLGYIKANVREDGRNVVRWLKCQPKKDYLAKQGMRAYRKKRSQSSAGRTSRQTRQNSKGRRTQQISKERKEAGRMLSQLRDEGYSNKELIEMCELGSGTVSRLVSPNPKYDYKNIDGDIFDRIKRVYESLVGGGEAPTKMTKTKAKPRAHANGVALAKSEPAGIHLPRSILESEDAAIVLKALVDSGQRIIIDPSK